MATRFEMLPRVEVRTPTEEELVGAIALLGRVKQKIEAARKVVVIPPRESRRLDSQLAAIYQDLLSLKVLLGQY